MPTPAQQLDLSSAVANIRSAEQLLDNIMAGTGDEGLLDALTAVYRKLSDAMTLLLAAQTAADDGTFAQATASLKAQAAELKAQEAEIQRLVANVELAAQVVGYIAQALTFVGAL